MLALGAAGGLAMAQAPASGTGTSGTGTSPGTVTSPGTATSPGLSKADKSFIHKAAEGGLAEVQLGQLAQQQGGSDAVKEFGQRMVTDHQAANEKLQSIAQGMNVQLPTELSRRDQATLTKLQGLHGAAFDKAYASRMKADHKTDIREFEHQAKHGENAELKQFADSTLPTLKEQAPPPAKRSVKIGAGST